MYRLGMYLIIIKLDLPIQVILFSFICIIYKYNPIEKLFKCKIPATFIIGILN